MNSRNCTMKDVFQSVVRERKSNFEPEEGKIFADWLSILKGTGVPFLVGGAFAAHIYTGIWRDTKDLDIFLYPRHVKRALDALAGAGYETEVAYHHWLAKAHYEPYLLDMIFGVWNGQLHIDEDWFKYSLPGEVAGEEIRIIPLEELLTSKLYVAARDRFDGSDVVHLIRCTKGRIDWSRVLARLGDNYEVLLWQLLLFDFVYPGHSDYLPKGLMIELFDRVRNRWPDPFRPPRFRGTLLDPFSFEVDIKDWGYRDPRNMDPIVDNEGALLEK